MRSILPAGNGLPGESCGMLMATLYPEYPGYYVGSVGKAPG